MFETECLHAPPAAGGSVSPCCGRTLAELPRYDRIVKNPDLVTCGRLNATEQLILSGQPVILDPANEQIMYTITTAVADRCGSSMTLQTAYDSVHTAMRQLLAGRPPLKSWTATLMVQVTTRAQELALRT